ncbi:peptidoglycan-binding protein [Arthrobacter sp. AFG7.2]|uniref:LysM peptidoglycan-binding domain-containing protein n=1 Tax=Arthrobacter sp. AFG7.2 TaxID=1688693 RepID=UPI000C9DFC62|nr:LysM peptidoglycan-binding domain-containing protein [Arthrobacter sp. AFG7.2]PNI09290.1 peptidoglycan-binding protein [Arthrobacter sp. AFG7.2]
MSATSVSRDSQPQLLSVQQLLSTPEKRQSDRPAPLPPLRLTRRGRIVLIGIPLVLLAALLFSLAGFFNSPAKASASAADLTTTPTVTVTVQPGESLWGIAASVAPKRDARDVVTDIVQLNNLPAGTVFPGQELFVPVN